MQAAFIETDLKREVASLAEMLGETRVRFRRRQTPYASSEKLVDLDREIRSALARPLTAELELEVRRLTASLRALDPH